MATPSAIAKKTERRQIEILEAVKVLMVKVAELKAKEPDTIELTAKMGEIPDQTGEILAAIGKSFAETRAQQDRTLHACAMMAAEITELKAKIISLEASVTAPPPATRSRTKK